jgi:N utilization substance protein A
VPEKQLSLAIGKEGQNARLAAKLTGWRVDVARPGDRAPEAAVAAEAAQASTTANAASVDSARA